MPFLYKMSNMNKMNFEEMLAQRKSEAEAKVREYSPSPSSLMKSWPMQNSLIDFFSLHSI